MGSQTTVGRTRPIARPGIEGSRTRGLGKIEPLLLLLAAVLAIAVFTSALAQAPAPATVVQSPLVERLDSWQGVARQTYTLSAVPAMTRNLKVFVNGMLALQGLDYTVGYQSVTFTALQVGAMQSPVVQVFYWAAP